MSTFRRLLGFLRPYRRAVVGSLLFAWLAMGMTVAIPWLVGETVDAVESSDRDAILPLAAALVGAGILRLGLTVVRRLIAGRVSVAVEFDLRERVYRHLQALELGFFDSQQTGQLMSRATVDLQSIRFFLGYGLIFLTQNALTLLLASAVMFAIQPWLAALALAPVPFVVMTAMRFNRRSRPALQEVQQRIAELTAEAEESVSGIRIVKAFAREDHMLDRFRRAVMRVFDQNLFSTRLRAFYSPLLGFLPSLGLAVILLVGGNQVIDGRLTLGEFTAFYTYLLMLIGPMRMLGMALGMAQRAVASGNRLFEVLDREPRVSSPPDAPPLPEGAGRVEFTGVSLRYDGAAPALEDIDLEVPAGATVALVGPTGSGKTSLVALIARLYDPSQGPVVVDGADVRSVDVGSLRRSVAFVADESFLFSATVAENISYARPEASQGEIELAARRAQAHDFIEGLPDGYDTLVGERGLTLSGGQRQRIAIARALVADPRILILDDATSSVDATTEAEIKRGLREAMEGRTTFVVAHRLSTISLADEIVVMEEGRIVDRGTHEDLLRALPALRGDRRARDGRPGVPPARPRGARGGGTAVTRGNGRRRWRGGDDVDAVTERDPETQRSDVAEETEDQANQPGRLAGTLLMFRDIWRLVRGEDERGRKVKWMLGLLRPYRRQVVLMMVALVAATAAGLAPPYLAGRAIDDGINAGDGEALDGDRRRLPGLGASVLGRDLRADVPRRVGRPAGAAGPARAHLLAPAGDVDRVLHPAQAGGSDLAAHQRRPGARLAGDRRGGDAVLEHADAGGVVVILLLLDVPLALVTFLTFPLLAVGSVVFRIASAGAYRATREKIANITAYLQETLSGVRVVRSFGQEGRHVGRMSELNEENREANMRTVYLNASYFPAVELLSAIGTAVILLYGGYQVIDGNIEIGVMVAFVGYLNQFFDPIQQISQLYTTYQQGMAALDKIFDLLDTAPDMTDKPGALDPGAIRGELRLDDVSFSYGGASRDGRDGRWRRSISSCPRGRRWRWSVRRGRGSRRWRSSWPGSMTPRRDA